MSLRSDVSTCRKQGFARIKGVFPKHVVDTIRAEALFALRDGSALERKNGFPTILYNPINEYLQDISGHEFLLDIVQEYFGHDSFELETQQYYFHLPGDPDEFAWHTDERFRPGAGNLYLQTAILIDDWTDENSAVEFIPGSHKQPFENAGNLRKFVRGDKQGVKLLGKPGDVLTWSNTVVHGSERNVSKFPRAYYMNGFRSTRNAEC